MKRGLDLEPIAAEEYSKLFGINTYTVGFVINPSAPHLGASADRRVFDPDESEPFGLLEIKCPSVMDVADCKYLKASPNGELRLKTTHEYYYQVMGQMGITGCTWCDFFVFTEEGYHYERIPYSAQFFTEMKTKLDQFFFDYFLPALAE